MKYLQKDENKSQKKIFKLIKISLGLLILVFIVEIWVANRLSTYGEQIQSIKESHARLILENQILENSIAQNQSLELIERKAQFLGFINIKDLEYIRSSPVALAR